LTTAEILNYNQEERMVYGWASVSTIDKKLVEDHHGDVIEAVEIEKAATNFMLTSRVSKEMHVGTKIGDVVHSLPITLDIAKSLGITTDREGWVVGVKVYDDEVWNKVKNGDLAAFSIGCRAKRKEVTL